MSTACSSFRSDFFACFRWKTTSVWAPLLLAIILGAGLAHGQSDAPQAVSNPPVRFGFSRKIFDSVNENDGRAALKMHAEAIGRSDGIAIDPNEPIFDDAAAIQRALEAKEIDVVSLPTDEFLALPPALVKGPLIAAIVQGKPDDEYLLVVRNDRGIENLSGLKGRHLEVQHGARAPFTLLWLDVLTMRENLGPVDRALGEVTLLSKPSRVVLPVFFGQADGCVVTRKSLDVLEELNPQLLRQLRVLATSQPIVPALFCFRADFSPTIAERLAAAITRLHTTVSGRQIITIFQSERLSPLAPTDLDSARALLAERAQLLRAYHNPAVTPASTPKISATR